MGASLTGLTKVQMAGPSLTDDLVVVAVLRQHVAVALPELAVGCYYEAAFAVWAQLRRENSACMSKSVRPSCACAQMQGSCLPLNECNIWHCKWDC